MIDKAKAPIIILIALIVISLILAGGGFYFLQKEKTKNLVLQEKLEELTTKQRITESKLEESKKKIADMDAKLSDAQIKIDSLTSDLEQEKTARQEAQSRIDQLSQDLEQQKGLRSDIEKRLGDAQGDLRRTQAQLKELDAQRMNLETKIDELKKQTQGVELGKIVVSPETTPATAAAETAKAAPAKKNRGWFFARKRAAAPAVSEASTPATPQGREGKVLVINKEYNFVVINLGSKDGVGVGDEFSLYHNDKYAGDVKIEKVHDSMAAAGFLAGDIKDKVAEGDKVVQKVK